MNIKKLNFTLIIAFLPYILFGQNYLSKEREKEIKLSGKYYYGASYALNEDEAKQSAFDNLRTEIITDIVNKSRTQNEILQAIRHGVHFDRLKQEGMIAILAWIAKDSVFVTQKPVDNTPPNPQPIPAPPVQPPIKEETVPDRKPVATDNPVLQALAACKNYREVRRIVETKGLVYGTINKRSKGFANPEKCIIAVFTADKTLSALLDAGGSSRTDLLTGKTINNPEQYYNQNEYFLWYLQQK